MEEVTFLTFVVPTLGRPSIYRTIESIQAQNDWNWKCIIMFDGIEPTMDTTYQNIIIRSCEKKGNAGWVRNEALKLVDTRWVAFVDDDDYILPTYMDKLKYYINSNPGIDVVIFSYKDETNNNIQPPPNFTDLVRCNVGISFAARMDFIREHNIEFDFRSVEDFDFLNKCKEAGGKYLLTHDIQYIVGRRSAWS